MNTFLIKHMGREYTHRTQKTTREDAIREFLTTVLKCTDVMVTPSDPFKRDGWFYYYTPYRDSHGVQDYTNTWCKAA